MPFLVERVIEDLAYPADLVPGEDEQTIYGVNIQSVPGDDYSGEVFRVDMPNAPESMAGASVTTIMSGLCNPAFLGRASGTGRMVVQCYGELRNPGNEDPTLFYPNSYYKTIGQALLECPSGAEVWPCQPIPHSNDPAYIHGPRGVAVAPDGGTVYVFEDELAFINDYVSGQLLAISGGTKEVMWAATGSPWAPSAYYDLFAAAGFLKIDLAGDYLWVPGTWGLDGAARVSVDARVTDTPGTDPARWLAIPGRYTGIGFRDPLPYGPGVPTPAYMAEYGGRLKRMWPPALDGSGLLIYDYRSLAPATTGEPTFTNLRGLAVTPGGQVFVSAANWANGGIGRFAGYHLALGTAYSPGTIFRVNRRTEPLPAPYRDDLGPSYSFPPDEEGPTLLAGVTIPPLRDDHVPGV